MIIIIFNFKTIRYIYTLYQNVYILLISIFIDKMRTEAIISERVVLSLREEERVLLWEERVVDICGYLQEYMKR